MRAIESTIETSEVSPVALQLAAIMLRQTADALEVDRSEINKQYAFGAEQAQSHDD